MNLVMFCFTPICMPHLKIGICSPQESGLDWTLDLGGKGYLVNSCLSSWSLVVGGLIDCWVHRYRRMWFYSGQIRRRFPSTIKVEVKAPRSLRSTQNTINPHSPYQLNRIESLETKPTSPPTYIDKYMLISGNIEIRATESYILQGSNGLQIFMLGISIIDT